MAESQTSHRGATSNRGAGAKATTKPSGGTKKAAAAAAIKVSDMSDEDLVASLTKDALAQLILSQVRARYSRRARNVVK